MPVDTRLTYDDCCLLPNNGQRCELVDGELFVTPSPHRAHQKVVTELCRILGNFVAETNCGEVFVASFDVVLSLFDVVEPDIIYVSAERAGRVTEKNVQGAPDLVVEVFSQSNAEIDRTTKLRLYARYGVLEYWLIDPDECTAEVYRREPQGFEHVASLQPADSLTSPLLPGFSVPLRGLAG